LQQTLRVFEFFAGCNASLEHDQVDRAMLGGLLGHAFLRWYVDSIKSVLDQKKGEDLDQKKPGWRRGMPEFCKLVEVTPYDFEPPASKSPSITISPPRVPDDMLKEGRERYEDIAKQIEREDGLVNTRTNWLVASEALLLGGVGLLATKAAEKEVVANPLVCASLLFGSAVLLVLGALIASKCRAALDAARIQLVHLKELWEGSRFLQQTYVPPFGDISQHDNGISYPVQIAAWLRRFSGCGATTFVYLALWNLGKVNAPLAQVFAITVAVFIVVPILAREAVRGKKTGKSESSIPLPLAGDVWLANEGLIEASRKSPSPSRPPDPERNPPPSAP
jgi:hypothetical protein